MPRALSVLLPAALAALALGGCGTATSPRAAAPSVASAPSHSSAPVVAAPPGPAGCPAAATRAAMATMTISQAVAASPDLARLAAVVRSSGMLPLLDGAPGITVFAPDNAAFTKLPPSTLRRIEADKALLAKVLTYHVVSRDLTPTQLAAGRSFTTMEGAPIVTSGHGSGQRLNRTAQVVCGGLRAGGATVYVVDTVLLPPGVEGS